MFPTRFGSGSALVGSAPVGNGPGAEALDEATHTLYVANGENDDGPNAGGNTVSVIDTRRCDALDVSRCRGHWPTVGNLPSAIAVDETTDTVYVANLADNTVSVFNGATCNGQNTSGCRRRPVTVPVGSTPIGIFADSVTTINGNSCNGTSAGGCGNAQTQANVGDGPGTITIDPTVGTAYVADSEGVSVIPLTP
jgi:DNA-binding beta-propeller fold protein YncE